MIRWLARKIWGWMLWSIRRPAARKLQRAALNLVPESRREAAHQSAIKQEKFARKIGLPLLTFVINLFFISVALTLILLFVLNANAEGWLVIPTREALNLDQPPNR
ncbi:MAG: hypothetical protein ACKVQS_09725 [Fimbriimonadaceae bacterium]